MTQVWRFQGQKHAGQCKTMVGAGQHPPNDSENSQPRSLLLVPPSVHSSGRRHQGSVGKMGFSCLVQIASFHLRIQVLQLEARDAGKGSVSDLRHGAQDLFWSPAMVETPPAHTRGAFGHRWHWHRNPEDIYFPEQRQTQGTANWPNSNKT